MRDFQPIATEQRARMTSVVFGVSAPPLDMCAVEGCDDIAKPQVCPIDKRYHRHGMIHYENARSGLGFRKGWWWLCDTHYRQITDACA